ncbi:Maltose permease [Penicillium riverlandense]|uniref:Maltose permease n=1 Tax=Penicillium riverlandense TaxID=1903569 RepID=UPI0025493067|nr:Maltose permease [Penicillium riverlandense]KAJ5815203.1 Maltose permease [Penicillium riverlandense]
MAETPEKSGIRVHWKSLAACSLISMSPFQYGVDFTLIGGFQAMIGFLKIFGVPADTPIGWNIPYERQQLISSLMTLGAFVGPIATFIGRKTSLYIACALIYISNIVMMTTSSIGGLYAGRLIIGVGNGFLMTFSQLYIQECSPARYRGLMLGAFQFWTSFGSLIGTIIDNFTAKIDDKNSYIIPLGLIYIIPAFLCGGMLIIPESPRWLLQKDRTEDARKALTWLRPNQEIVDQEMADIQSAIELERNLASGVSVWDMFTNPVDRRRTILAVAAVSTQAGSGAMYMIAYGTYFFEMANVGDAFENSCILTALGVVAILVNIAVVTRLGRRRFFLMTGLLICGFSQLIVAAIYTVHPGTESTGKATVGLSVIFILGYNGMVSTYAWVSGGELPSQRLRSYTFGFAAAIGFLGAWLTTFTAPYFINPDSLNWGPKYGYIWFPSCLISAAFIFFYLPEVKGRTLEEIDEMFEKRLPARKFASYKCVGREALQEMQTSRAHTEDTVHRTVSKESEKGTTEVYENIA